MVQEAQSTAADVLQAPAGYTGQNSVEKASSTDNPEVLAERCDFLYRRITPAIVATIALSLLLDAFLWRTRPIPLLVFWQSTVLVLAVGFWALGWFYRREKTKGAIDPEPWVRWAAKISDSSILSNTAISFGFMLSLVFPAYASYSMLYFLGFPAYPSYSIVLRTRCHVA